VGDQDEVLERIAGGDQLGRLPGRARRALGRAHLTGLPVGGRRRRRVGPCDELIARRVDCHVRLEQERVDLRLARRGDRLGPRVRAMMSKPWPHAMVAFPAASTATSGSPTLGLLATSSTKLQGPEAPLRKTASIWRCTVGFVWTSRAQTTTAEPSGATATFG